MPKKKYEVAITITKSFGRTVIKTVEADDPADAVGRAVGSLTPRDYESVRLKGGEGYDFAGATSACAYEGGKPVCEAVIDEGGRAEYLGF